MNKNGILILLITVLYTIIPIKLPAVIFSGDLSQDGKVDIEDMTLLATDWLKSYNLFAFRGVSSDWQKTGGAARWVSDLFNDDQGSQYTGWSEIGGSALYTETNGRLLWALGSNEINHLILNNTEIEADILDIQVDVSASDSVGTFYIYFLYQDSNNWYRLKVEDGETSASSQFQKKINGVITNVGYAGNGVDISGNQGVTHWQIIIDTNTGNMKFVHGVNVLLNIAETIAFSSGHAGLGGSGRRPVWDNFNINNDKYKYENGYELWLRYARVDDPELLTDYRNTIAQLVVQGNSDTFTAVRSELNYALNTMLDSHIPLESSLTIDNTLVAGTPESSPIINALGLDTELNRLGTQGYLIRNTTVSGKNIIAIASKGEIGLLYGTFHFLKIIQTQQKLSLLDIQEKPKLNRRLLNHWDGLNGGASRGYMGNSLWRWDELPDTISPRYKDYARACASVGINGMVPNNVNASSTSLSTEYIDKLAVIANELRPYGVRVYLTAKFSAPIDIGQLTTADPLNPAVINWWDNKANEIYDRIPDFGGFLVKANSEGQPGPNDYGRSHAQGANMMAEVLDEHGGVVMWRAFVYSTSIDPDRSKHAYMEFKPLDGQF
ncbi:MAG: hypothetical protein JW745_03165, partial [Sedimentisphaerales bacterium]|nr:hypothetical protein [Sedimentisphaerales bacterium]